MLPPSQSAKQRPPNFLGNRSAEAVLNSSLYPSSKPRLATDLARTMEVKVKIRTTLQNGCKSRRG